jgi:two-component system CheB/CheR fusion protein
MSEDQPDVNAEELLKSLFDRMREHAIVLLNTDGRIVGWLAAAERLFGYLPNEIIGQPVSILFTPENRAAGMVEYEQDVARTDSEAEDDRWMLRKDGGRFWATGVLTPIRNTAGQLIGFGKILRDRTDVRAEIQTLVKQNASLKQAEQSKNRFISTLSHELRNPLGSLSLSLELLKLAENDPKSIADVTATMASEVITMRRMVDDLIDVSRMSAGKVHLEMQCQDLRPVIEAAVASCRPSIDMRTHHLNVIVPIAPLLVKVDAVRMRQVFVNLIQNATNYTKNGGTIWVKAGVEAAEAVVKVEDNGIGISPEVLPHIFDMFTQAEFIGDRSDAGLGIGLSVVKDLTQLHGGSVQVRSEGIGKGSEFIVRLPLDDCDDEPHSPG